VWSPDQMEIEQKLSSLKGKLAHLWSEMPK